MAGTMESKRENSNRSGVSRCWRVLSGIKGPEERTILAVGNLPRGFWGGDHRVKGFVK